MEEELEHIGVVKDDCNGFPWKRIGYVCETDLAVLPIGAKVYGPNVVESLRTQIAAQAAVIEKLRVALTEASGDPYFYELCAESQYAIEQALAITTDSKQILADWLDSVLGEPVAWTNATDTYVCLADKNTVYGSHTIPLFKKPETKQ